MKIWGLGCSASVMNIYHKGYLLSNGTRRPHGVMVSTLDFESSDPSSNLGGTFRASLCQFFFFFSIFLPVISLKTTLSPCKAAHTKP